jgi:hypothetical protein
VWATVASRGAYCWWRVCEPRGIPVVGVDHSEGRSLLRGYSGEQEMGGNCGALHVQVMLTDQQFLLLVSIIY